MKEVAREAAREATREERNVQEHPKYARNPYTYPTYPVPNSYAHPAPKRAIPRDPLKPGTKVTEKTVTYEKTPDTDDDYEMGWGGMA